MGCSSDNVIRRRGRTRLRFAALFGVKPKSSKESVRFADPEQNETYYRPRTEHSEKSQLYYSKRDYERIVSTGDVTFDGRPSQGTIIYQGDLTVKAPGKKKSKILYALLHGKTLTFFAASTDLKKGMLAKRPKLSIAIKIANDRIPSTYSAKSDEFPFSVLDEDGKEYILAASCRAERDRWLGAIAGTRFSRVLTDSVLDEGTKKYDPVRERHLRKEREMNIDSHGAGNVGSAGK